MNSGNILPDNAEDNPEPIQLELVQRLSRKRVHSSEWKHEICLHKT